ncbi:hypothetical protein [Streptomyces vinaceus]|uniref:hypothetical protein n=1 Tax=Streptomyces vinaceus TaxID=1960 RepID=UPI0038215411
MPDNYSWLREAAYPAVLTKRAPSSLKELTKPANSEWQKLFGSWVSDRYGSDRAERYFAVTAERRQGYGQWFDSKRLDFFWTTSLARFLTDLEEARTAWKAREARAKKAAGSTWRGGRDDQRQRFEKWVSGERTKAAVRSDSQGAHLNQIEAWLTAHTQKMKPQFAKLYQALGDVTTQGEKVDVAAEWDEVKRIRQELEAAYGQVLTAEGTLRMLVRPADGRAPHVQQAQEAWAALVDSYAALADAVVRAARHCHAWASSHARNEMQKNFATAFPVINGLLLAMEGLVVGMRICLAAIGTTGALMAVTAPVSAALAVASETVQELARRAVASEAAKDPRRMREHVGRFYDQDPAKRLLGKDPEESVATAARYVARTGRVAAEIVRSNVKAATAAKVLPYVGEAAAIGAFSVHLAEQFNRKILVDDVNREHFLAMFDEASLHVRQAQLGQCSVTVHSFVPSDRTADVTLNGVRGTLQHGRFTPQDRTGVFRLVAQRWFKNGGPHLEGNLTVMAAHGTAGPDDLLDPACAEYIEIGHSGTFHVTATAQRPERNATSFWKVRFSLSAEGSANALESVWQGYRVHTPDGLAITISEQELAQLLEDSVDTVAESFDDLRERQGWDGRNFTALRSGENVVLMDDDTGILLTNAEGKPAVLPLHNGPVAAQDLLAAN